MIIHTLMPAALPTATAVKDWIFPLLQDGFTAAIACFLLVAFVQKAWGILVGLLLVGAVVALSIFLPDVFMDMLKSLGNLLPGQG